MAGLSPLIRHLWLSLSVCRGRLSSASPFSRLLRCLVLLPLWDLCELSPISFSSLQLIHTSTESHDYYSQAFWCSVNIHGIIPSAVRLNWWCVSYQMYQPQWFLFPDPVLQVVFSSWFILQKRQQSLTGKVSSLLLEVIFSPGLS